MPPTTASCSYRGNGKVDPADEAKAEAWLDKWLEDRRGRPHFAAYDSWVRSYRELRLVSAAFAAEEENLRRFVEGSVQRC